MCHHSRGVDTEQLLISVHRGDIGAYSIIAITGGLHLQLRHGVRQRGADALLHRLRLLLGELDLTRIVDGLLGRLRLLAEPSSP